MRSRTFLGRLVLVGTGVASAALVFACGSSSSGGGGGGSPDATSGDDQAADGSIGADAHGGNGGDAATSDGDDTLDGSSSAADGSMPGDDDGSTASSDAGDGATGATDGSSGTSDAGQDAAADADAGPATANVHFYGRMDTTVPAQPKFDWSGSGVEATFKGTGVSVSLSSEDTGSGNNEIEVVIDGTQASSKVLTAGATQVVSLITGLPNTNHTVEIYKRTEAYVGIVQFLGFQADSGDTTWALVPSVDPLGARHIEFIGDSITCGYGVLGVSVSTADTCDPTNDNESEYEAYGADTARALTAAHSVVAFSGKGVYRDANGNTTSASDPQIPALYTRTLENESTSTYGFSQQMDAVVINLGTNDFAGSDPGMPFVTAFESFVGTVRSKYPNAYILLVAGPMITEDNTFGGAIDRLNTYLTDVVNFRKAAPYNDTQIGMVDVASQDCDTEHCGCADHPSVARQQTMANTVVAALKTAKGW